MSSGHHPNIHKTRDKVMVTSRIKGKIYSFGPSTTTQAIRALLKQNGFQMTNHASSAKHIIVPDSVDASLLEDRMIHWGKFSKTLEKEKSPSSSKSDKKKHSRKHLIEHAFVPSVPDVGPVAIEDEIDLFVPSPAEQKADEEVERWVEKFQHQWKETDITQDTVNNNNKRANDHVWYFTQRLLKYEDLAKQMQFALANVAEAPPHDFSIEETDSTKYTALLADMNQDEYDWTLGLHRLQQASKLYPVLESLLRYWNLALSDAWSKLADLTLDIWSNKSLVAEQIPISSWQFIQTWLAASEADQNGSPCADAKRCVIAVVSLYRWCIYHANVVKFVLTQTYTRHQQWVSQVRQHLFESVSGNVRSSIACSGLFQRLGDHSCVRPPLWFFLPELTEAVLFPNPPLSNSDLGYVQQLIEILKRLLESWYGSTIQVPNTNNGNLSQLCLYYATYTQQYLIQDANQNQVSWPIPPDRWQRLSLESFQQIPWTAMESPNAIDHQIFWQMWK